MKRYLAFCGSTYYPCGGWSDFVGDFDSIEAAMGNDKMQEACNEAFHWWHIVDKNTMEAVGGIEADMYAATTKGSE